MIPLECEQQSLQLLSYHSITPINLYIIIFTSNLFFFLGNQKKHILYTNCIYARSDTKHVYIQSEAQKTTTGSTRNTHIHEGCVRLTSVHIRFDGDYNTQAFHSSQTSKWKHQTSSVKLCKPQRFGLHNCAVFVLAAGHVLSLTKAWKPSYPDTVNSFLKNNIFWS